MRLKYLMVVPFTNENFDINSNQVNIINNNIKLGKGKYTVFISFVVEKDNLGDMLTLYLNDEVIKNIDLPIEEESNVKMKIPLEVNEDNSNLFLLNESDDTVIIKKIMGGIFMAVNLQIVNVLNFNPYSFDLELNVPFTSDIIVKVTEIAPDSTETQVLVNVLDKLDLNAVVETDMVKTIVPISAPTTLFKINYNYRIEVSLGNESDSDIKSFNFTTFTMMNDKSCSIKTIGSRLLVVEFDYPVQNLDYLNSYMTTNYARTSLNNFYISYFAADPNVGQQYNEWVGSIDIERTPSGGGTTIYPFSIKVSSDSTRLEIQNNLGEFNTGSSNIVKNHFAINVSKDQDPTMTLEDYSNREIASFEAEFLASRNSVPAKVVNVEAKSSYEVEITFDAPVCSLTEKLNPSLFKLYKVVTGQANQSLTISEVKRVGNNFNKLMFVLSPPNTNVLPFPEVTLTVGPLLDASGLITDTFTKAVIVPRIYPTVSLYSVNSDTDLGTTSIALKYSELMDKTLNGTNSSINPLNYRLQNKTTGQVILINSITSGLSSLTAVITIGLLQNADYSIIAYEEIQSITGNNIETTELSFKVVNSIIPTIDKVLATKPDIDNTNMTSADNSFVIVFNQPMNLEVNDVHSALTQSNYKLRINNKSYELDESTIIESIYNNRWVRYTLPVDPNNPIPDFVQSSANYLIHIGYSTATDIKWVTSAEGNIYPLCDTKQANYLLDKLNINNGIAAAISENVVVYELNSDINKATIVNNLFSYINALDFQAEITRDGVVTNVRAISAVLEANSFANIELTFPDGTFNIGDSIVLKVNPEDAVVRSLDIFGKPILIRSSATVGEVNVSNKVPTSIEGISLLSIASTGMSDPNYSEALIELIFAMSIQDTESSDFDVYYKDALGINRHCNVISAVPVASIGDGRPVTIQLKALVPNDADLEKLLVSTVPGTLLSPFMTHDISNNKVSQFTDMVVRILTTEAFEWTYNAKEIGGYDSYTFELDFSEDILTKYAFDVSTTIPITVTPDNSTLLLDLVNNGSENLALGSLKLYFNNGILFTGDTYNWSAASALSATDKSKLVITISETTGTADLFAVGKVNQSLDRGRAVYIPYTSTSVRALIVNSTDKAQLFRLDRDTHKIV